MTDAHFASLNVFENLHLLLERWHIYVFILTNFASYQVVINCFYNFHLEMYKTETFTVLQFWKLNFFLEIQHHRQLGILVEYLILILLHGRLHNQISLQNLVWIQSEQAKHRQEDNVQNKRAWWCVFVGLAQLWNCFGENLLIKCDMAAHDCTWGASGMLRGNHLGGEICVSVIRCIVQSAILCLRRSWNKESMWIWH